MEEYLSKDLVESGIYVPLREILFFHMLQLDKINEKNSIWIMNGSNKVFTGLIDKKMLLFSTLGNKNDMFDELYCCISDFGNEIFIKSIATNESATVKIEETFHAKYYNKNYGEIKIGESTLEYQKSLDGEMVQDYVSRADCNNEIIWNSDIANDWDFMSNPGLKPLYYYPSDDNMIDEILDEIDKINIKKKKL